MIFVLVLFQMTDDPQDICDQGSVSEPRIAAFIGDESTTYFLFIESKIVFSVITTFTKALMLWFASHYVFNLEYCKSIKSIALFFQEFVFSLPEKSTKGATYLTVTSDITKYID